MCYCTAHPVWRRPAPLKQLSGTKHKLFSPALLKSVLKPLQLSYGAEPVKSGGDAFKQTTHISSIHTVEKVSGHLLLKKEITKPTLLDLSGLSTQNSRFEFHKLTSQTQTIKNMADHMHRFKYWVKYCLKAMLSVLYSHHTTCPLISRGGSTLHFYSNYSNARIMRSRAIHKAPSPQELHCKKSSSSFTVQISKHTFT